MKLKLIFLNDCLPELRSKVPDELIVPGKYVRFQDGSGTVKLPTECRGQDVFIICDVNDKTPNPYTGHILSPDDHVRDISRANGALKGNPARKSLVVPFQPYGRQHRRVNENGVYESIEAADFLRDCHYLGFHNILTVDSHHPDVAAAISKHNFDNMYVTNNLLTSLVINENIDYEDIDNILVVAPDEGAQQRAKHFASRFGCSFAYYIKDRNRDVIVNGKNPIGDKIYNGKDPNNHIVILVDDMISSGETLLKTAEDLKNRGAKEIYICATFGLFTETTKKFVAAYRSNIINGTYISNLTYLTPQEMAGINRVDCTEQLLNGIEAIHENRENISEELGNKVVSVKELVLKRTRRK